MIYDIVIVGAGPAGLTAGANAANRGLKTLILEGQSKPGGQPQQFYPKKLIIDHPGFPKGITGRDLSRRLFEQALHSKAEIRLGEPMVDLDIRKKIKVIFTRKNTYEAKRVIFCTGLHNIPRHPNCLKDYKGKNVNYFVKNPRYYRNKKVLILGGGDTAFDRAILLLKYTKKITLILRDRIPKAKESSVQQVLEKGIEINCNTELVRLIKKDKTAVLLNSKTKQKTIIKIDEVVVSIGFVSSLDVLNKAGLKKDGQGMIKVNDRMETSVAGVFAAGDLVGDVKLIAVACSEGIIAAISTFNSIKKPYWLNK